jgi:hypothetical protein
MPMLIKSSKFKEISKEYQLLAKCFTDADIKLDYKYVNGYDMVFYTNYSALQFKTIGKMYEFNKHRPIVLSSNLLKNNGANTLVFNDTINAHIAGNKYILKEISTDHARQFKTLKFTPSNTPESVRPKIIEQDPIEFTEGDHTYRFLTEYKDWNSPQFSVICRNDDKMYDYLDKGFYFHTIEHTVGFKKTYRHVVANAYDVNVAHIFAMCCAEPKLIDMLQHGCFINVHTAEMTRLKMSKKLNDGKSKSKYSEHISNAIETDYKQNTTLLVVGKLVEGSIDKTTINNISFTKSGAIYEQISIEADNLLDVLYQELNFNGEFDIYTITNIYAAHMEKTLNKSDPEQPQDAPAVADEGEPVEQQPEQDVELEGAERKIVSSVKINNISINTSISKTYQRYINGVRINKDELAKAISRASCYHNEDDYKLFLKSISRMSIKYHDIIANGLPVKIHSTITRDEYATYEPGPLAPALKLCIDSQHKHFKLQVDKDRLVRVHLGKLIKKVEVLNKKTNGKNYYGLVPGGFYKTHGVRNYIWCAEQLVNILIECSTFQRVQKKEDGTEELVSEVLITRGDIVKLLDVVNEQKRQVIERSKEFLATAVKLTDAKIIEFLGKQAYHVKGTLREYAVIIETAKVYDFATKQYRCIVNDRHYAGAGYDDIAARLLALKNDSTMQQHIGTLRGAAQPGAENVHNDYVPERDPSEKLEELVTKVFDDVVENK